MVRLPQPTIISDELHLRRWPNETGFFAAE